MWSRGGEQRWGAEVGGGEGTGVGRLVGEQAQRRLHVPSSHSRHSGAFIASTHRDIVVQNAISANPWVKI